MPLYRNSAIPLIIHPEGADVKGATNGTAIVPVFGGRNGNKRNDDRIRRGSRKWRNAAEGLHAVS